MKQNIDVNIARADFRITTLSALQAIKHTADFRVYGNDNIENKNQNRYCFSPYFPLSYTNFEIRRKAMTITKNSFVAIDYTLSGDDGEVIDTSKGKTPLEYIHGNGYLIPGMESALEGKSEGDEFSIVIEPKDGYGEYDNNLVSEVKRDQFETDAQIEVGMQFQAMTAYGPQIVTVTKVTDSAITVDANHELAGKTLHFDVKVVSVREATKDELDALSSGCGGSCGGCGGECGDGGCGN